ncbi:NlpC/P60 family protein [Streptomyces sp. ODS28]|uniref:C40 family peptidase n=1 Tax=Streptomyces sp. ODS28 TaxID=3136688 RepID=UPI0031EAEB69
MASHRKTSPRSFSPRSSSPSALPSAPRHRFEPHPTQGSRPHPHRRPRAPFSVPLPAPLPRSLSLPLPAGAARALSGNAARAVLTLAIAGTATATAYEGSGHAAPRPSAEQIKSRSDALHREAERAAERSNGAQERADQARHHLEDLRDESARRQSRLNSARDELGSFATAQYRNGGLDPALQLVLSSSPSDYLDRAAVTERAGVRQSDAVRQITEQARSARQVREEAAETERSLRHASAAARAHKRTARNKAEAADRLLDRLPPDERARVLGDPLPRSGDDSAGTHASHTSRAPGGAAGREALGKASGRAAQALAFARAALGKPYVWGATGPDSYDCSGLTQAAWRAAGVSLPRTTYAQIDAGTRVPRSQLAPGDLVFFYDSVSHVGIYTGNGTMIHAPRPGTAVRSAPVDEMPFAGAVRPA